RPKLRAENGVPVARDGIAVHVALPSRKGPRGAIPARSGAPHGPAEKPAWPHARSPASSVELAEEIALADLDAVVAQERVRGDDVKPEVWYHPRPEVCET